MQQFQKWQGDQATQAAKTPAPAALVTNTPAPNTYATPATADPRLAQPALSETQGSVVASAPSVATSKITNAASTGKAKQQASQKFQAFLNILNGVAALGTSGAGIYAAIKGPKIASSGPALRASSAGTLSAPAGHSSQALSQLSPSTFTPLTAEKYVLKSGLGGNNDIVELLKSMRG